MPRNWLSFYEKEVVRLGPGIPNRKEPDWTSKRVLGSNPRFGFFTVEDFLAANIPLDCSQGGHWIYGPKHPFDCIRGGLSQGCNVGVLTGRISGNLHILDYDLQKVLGSQEKARDWRKAHLDDLRSLRTWITLTISGGIHIWLRASSLERIHNFIESEQRKRNWELDLTLGRELIRSENGWVVVPPSMVNGHSYFFLDNLNGLSIRNLDQ